MHHAAIIMFIPTPAIALTVCAAQDDGSEYTDESSGDEGARLAKPVFVTKEDRDTIAERERKEAAEAAEAAAQKQRAAARVVRCAKLGLRLRSKQRSQYFARLFDMLCF